LAELCERVIKRPVRVAAPNSIAKLPVELAEPQFATAMGLAMYAHRTVAAKMSPEHGLSSRLRAFWTRLGA
jgi:cell division protein FtsA